MCTKVYALVLMLFAAVSVYGQDNVIDEVVWVVGDEAILKSDVENERLNAQYEGRKFDGDPYCIIPEQLAIQKLFLHQAAIDSIEVSEQEIISDVERRTNWLIDQIGSKEKVEEYYNKTSTQIREMLRENIRDGKTVQKMQQQIVGDIKITPAEVRRYFKDLPQDSIPFIPTQVEVQIITMEPKIPQEEIISDVERRTNWLIDQIGSKEKVEEYYNKTSTQIREMLRENIRDGKTVQKMQQQIVGDIKITPAEVRRYFKDLPQDSIPFIPTQVEVQIITMEPKIPQEEIERVKKTLRDYTERVTSGEIAFSTLARLYSEDEGSRRRGGELGFMGRAELVPEYANVAFNLQDPNKVSKIVESEFGFHIIQLIEKRGDRINTRHILLKPKVDEKDLEAALLRLDSIANDIRNEKFTFDDAATYISHDKDTRNNHGLMANPQTGTARFEMQQLAQVSQEAAKMVEGMNVGEISKPFTMINAKGKEICAIVKLKTRLNGHKATITEDYQRLKGIVMEKRSEEKLDKWIKDKQKHTYVRINEKWQKCDFKYPGWVKK